MTADQPFSEMASENRNWLLGQLHDWLINNRIETREQFLDLMQVAFDQKVFDPQTLSNEMGYSVSAVYRWVEGVTAPHPSLWPTIHSWLRERFKAQLTSRDNAE